MMPPHFFMSASSIDLNDAAVPPPGAMPALTIRSFTPASARAALTSALIFATTSAGSEGWAAEYLAALRARPVDADAPLDLLVEQAQAPHHTAWWVNGIQLKLGLLGKVIGFSILALQIGSMQNFDPAQSQELLKRQLLSLKHTL